jgi:hypothetical protein
LAKDRGVKIKLDSTITQLPPEVLRCTFEATPGVTLMTLLQEFVRPSLPSLEVLFEFDTIVVTNSGSGKSEDTSQPAPSAPKALGPPAGGTGVPNFPGGPGNR